MTSTAKVAELAALAGDPARTAMLQALMDGRALTAGELAVAAGVTPQTASGHLARMVAAGLLAVAKQGRHRYHRLASAAVAETMEGLMRLAGAVRPTRNPPRLGPADIALRRARTCYDHIAGRLGVALADALTARGHAEIAGDGGIVTESGLAFFGRLGIAIDTLNGTTARRGGRVLCRPCLDWSERRPHLAGALGAALCEHALRDAWVRRLAGTRALSITPKGARVFRETFGADLDERHPASRRIGV